MGNPFLIAEDTALKTLLQGMTVGDEKTASRPVKVWFGYPDVEVRAQEFPFVTIDLIDMIPANDRQTSGQLVDNDYRGTVAPIAGKTYRYEIPVAFDLIYQVTTYARHPRHDRAMMLQLTHKFPSKYGGLLVPNELGTETSRRHMFLDGFAKRDAVDGETGNRRLLRNIYTVRIISELTPLDAGRRASQVEDVLINLPELTDQTSNIPTGLTIV
jgi:hypothetical protein